MSDIYVLVPGILGSVLEKDGKDAFGFTAEAGFRALFSGGGSIRDLRLSDDQGDGPDGVTATRLAADAHLLPGLWKVDGYGKVGAYLRRRLRLTAGVDYFEFPYDWRRDNRVAARQLSRAAEGWLEVRRRTHPDARLVLIAHSMGGLVARYYLECLGGWRDCRSLVTFGTPYRGSLNALDVLVNGFRKAFGLVDLTELVASFPSVYQLLPIFPCVDRGTGDLARLTEIPGVLPHLEEAGVTAARRFHQEIEDAVERHRDDDDYRRHAYSLHQIVGIDQPTSQSARWSAPELEVLRHHGGVDHGGDGTVPRVSASPQELEDDAGAMFSTTRHASLQNADAVLTQVRGLATSVRLRGFRAGAPIALSLDVEDVQTAGEPLRATVVPSSATRQLDATLTWLGGPGAPPQRLVVPLPPVDGPRQVEFPAAPPGCYRLEVTGDDDVEPVADLLTVAPA